TAPARTVADVSRATTAWLATGAYAMLAGAVFAAPFLLNARSQQNDVFFTNLFVAPALFSLGLIAFIASWHGLGLKGWSTVAVFAATQVLLAVLLFLLGGRSGLAPLPALAAIQLADVPALVIVSSLIAGTRGHLDAWRRALLLAVAGAGAMTLIY